VCVKIDGEADKKLDNGWMFIIKIPDVRCYLEV